MEAINQCRLSYFTVVIYINVTKKNTAFIIICKATPQINPSFTLTKPNIQPLIDLGKTNTITSKQLTIPSK